MIFLWIPYQLIIMTFKLSDFISVSFKVFFFSLLFCSFFVCCFVLLCCCSFFFFLFALTRIKPFGYKSGDSTGNEQSKKILPG